MPWRDYLLTFCILFAFLFHAGNGVEAGINRRSVLEEDADFIISLSEQLYRRGESIVAEEKRENDAAEKKKRVEAAKEDDEDGVEEEDEEREEEEEEEKTPSDKDVVQRDQDAAGGSGTGSSNGPKPTPTEKDGVVVAPLVSAGGAGDGLSHTYLVIMIAVCCLAGVIALILATVCYYNVQNKKAQTKEIPYMSTPVYEYKAVPSTKNYSGTDYAPGLYPTDNALALSAQKFHFQHEKEKLIAMENEKSQMEPSSHLSVDCTDEVYETPGLAPMWDVEVTCPLYTEDVTPGTTPRDHTPMMRTDSDGSGEESGGGGSGGEGGRRRENGDFNHINGNATDSPPLINGPKFNLHLGFENEGLTSHSNAATFNGNGIDAEANGAVENNNNNATGAPVNGVNGINGVNGFHE